MKKLFMIGTLCAALVIFVSTPALADTEVCGWLEVQEIRLYESYVSDDVPIAPCELELYVWTEDQGPWVLPATAFGTQLNLALLKAYNEALAVEGCLLVDINPGDPPTITLRVHCITFAESGESNTKGSRF